MTLVTSIPTIIKARLPSLTDDNPVFWSSFVASCDEVRPPYGCAWYGELFRESALNLNWLAKLLVVNAQKEADGARQLWALAGRIDDPSRRNQVRVHAIDESRHASYYISMLELAFPDAATNEQLRELRAISPGYKASDAPELTPSADNISILDEIIQMNIGEVRTLVNQMLMRPVLDVIAPAKNRKRLLGLIDALGADELSHVSYTANVIEDMSTVADIPYIMTLRMQEFAEITCKEVGRSGAEESPFT